MYAFDIILNPMQNLLSVTRLNALVASLLEGNFSEIWVEGEVSNLIKASSGHWYFSLKDENAQIRCAMFRFSNRLLNFEIKHGDHIIVKAKVSLYQPRGDYQLIVSSIELAGEGLLKQRFEQLKSKLVNLGWFAATHKQPIPRFPSRIGVITSPTGAVIRDIVHVLGRRCPSIEVIVYPSLVQGEKAAAELVRMVNLANQLKQVDLLIIARGGGSLEDLWSFNEESVAEAVFHSSLPIISAVGHETDFTIADFVADKRAPTPSAAAEIASPDQVELKDKLVKYRTSLVQHMHYLIQSKAQTLDRLRLGLKHPGDVLKQHRLEMTKLLGVLNQRMAYILQDKQHQLMRLAEALDNLSPLKTLGRGYALVSKLAFDLADAKHDDAQEAISSVHQLAIGDWIHLRLKDGAVKAEIKNKIRVS